MPPLLEVMPFTIFGHCIDTLRAKGINRKVMSVTYIGYTRKMDNNCLFFFLPLCHIVNNLASMLELHQNHETKNICVQLSKINTLPTDY